MRRTLLPVLLFGVAAAHAAAAPPGKPVLLTASSTAQEDVRLVGGIHALVYNVAKPKKQEGVVKRGSLKDWSSTPGLEGLERPFEYLARTNLATLPLGRTTIDGDDVYVLVSEAETRPPEQVRFEAHRRYIDIQLVVHGQEAIGLAPAATLVTTEPYDATKDIEFFAPPRESVTLAVRAGEFAVFVPGDAHRPSLHLDGPHVTRKAVVKVSAEYRERQRAAAAR